MAIEDKIEAVKKVSKVLQKQSVPEMETVHNAPNQERFQNLMAEKSAPQPATVAPVEDVKSVSLMDEVKKLNTAASPVTDLDPVKLQKQTQDAVAKLDHLRTQLADAQGEIKPSYQALLKNRLTHIDESIKIALTKAGTETPAAATPPLPANPAKGAAGPMEKFIGLLTQGQYQLEHLSQTIDTLNLTGGQLTPANMLSLQIKVGIIQQEIELFTSLLNKALESTKTIMNVQV